MTSVDGACGNSPIQLNDEPLELDDVSQNSEVVESVEEAFSDRIDDLREQLDGRPNSPETAEIKQEIEDLKSALKEFKSEVRSLDSEAKIAGMEVADADAAGEVTGELEALIDEAQQTISDSYAEFGTAEISGETDQGVSEWSPIGENIDQLDGVMPDPVAEELALDFGGELEETGEASATGDAGGADEASDIGDTGDIEGTTESADTDSASETDGTDATSDAGGGEGIEGLDRSADEMVELMSNDPDAFMEEMSDLAPEDRMLAMNTIQQQLQEMNQMFQMMSQFSQAIHDTQKAVIQNMRV